MSIEVIRAGLLTSVQDAGRTGVARLGVGRAGAMDAPAWQLANALVGNSGGEAALEITLSGPTLRFTQDAVIALTGAPAAWRADDQPLPAWTCCFVPSGTVLQVGGMTHGCRSYLAVRGGLAVAPVLGSRSTDLHAGIGPRDGRALQAGDVLAIGPSEPVAAFGKKTRTQALRWGVDPRPWLGEPNEPLPLLRGHHYDLLDTASQRALFSQRFVLGKDGNRTGQRLDGDALRMSHPLELVSEATLPGTMQLPPAGLPIVLMAEAPVTGGYPRIGQLAAVALPRLAQRRPGDAVYFRECSLDDARQRLHDTHERLHRLIARVQQRLEPA